jgi:hypothetical protein
MSQRHVDQVMKIHLPPGVKFMLVALAYLADEKSSQSRVSQDGLVELTGYSPTQVQRLLKQCLAERFLEVLERKNGAIPTLYRLTLEWALGGAAAERKGGAS